MAKKQNRYEEAVMTGNVVIYHDLAKQHEEEEEARAARRLADRLVNAYRRLRLIRGDSHNDISIAAFSDDWYKTGDVARVDEAGYLYIVDRTKDIIITGGENVYSKEVEDALASHPQVVEAAVIGKPHPEWGQTVVAMVVPAKDSSLSEEALKEHLAGRLAKYKIPREFKLVEALPRTPTGKVMKYKLREEMLCSTFC